MQPCSASSHCCRRPIGHQSGRLLVPARHDIPPACQPSRVWSSPPLVAEIMFFHATQAWRPSSHDNSSTSTMTSYWMDSQGYRSPTGL